MSDKELAGRYPTRLPSSSSPPASSTYASFCHSAEYSVSVYCPPSSTSQGHHVTPSHSPVTEESGDVDTDVGPTPAAVCDGGGEEGGREGGEDARTDKRTPEVRGEDDLVCVCSICCI